MIHDKQDHRPHHRELETLNGVFTINGTSVIPMQESQQTGNETLNCNAESQKVCPGKSEKAKASVSELRYELGKQNTELTQHKKTVGSEKPCLYKVVGPSAAVPEFGRIQMSMRSGSARPSSRCGGGVGDSSIASTFDASSRRIAKD